MNILLVGSGGREHAILQKLRENPEVETVYVLPGNGGMAGEGTCVGIPELIPGRFISVKGLDGDTEGSYFLSRVRHRFTGEGYYTQFEVKGARA